ncbi:MAG: alpha/beta fold hydrolase [Burkholderiales bacterium]|nr:alpha/beta fold hydrolase [Burkholderiales bacterium]
MPAVRRDGVDVYYEVRGRGPPVMLVAGLAADSSYWMPTVDALADRFEVVLVDNRGSGRTTPLGAPTSIGAMADDCMALARHLRLARVSLVGHSMGGMIVQDCAARYPDTVDRLVLVATGAKASARDNDLFASWAELFPAIDRGLWFRNLFYWVFTPRFFEGRTAVDALVQLATRYPYQQTSTALANQVRAIAAFDGTPALSSIRARTLVLAGTEALLFPVAASAAFAKSIPHATFAAVEGAAHSIPMEHPQEFVQRVLPFLGA